MGSWIESSQGRARAGLIGLWLALALLGIAVLGAAGARASTVSKSGPTLTYTAAAGETNQAVISLSGASYTVDDPGATVTAGAGCTSVDSNTATCAAAGVTGITANVGNLNDVLWVIAPTASTLTGGDGNDTLIGGAGADVLIGCVGDDTLIGGAGSDQLFDGFFNCTGGGNDSFDGGTGNDGMFGGTGTDTATYANRTTPLTVILDGVANDGEAGEGDSVSTDIENVTGGSGDDNIIGSPAANTLRGEGGDDAIAGGDGADQLLGGTGDDLLNGGPGIDSFDGGAGEDEIRALDGVIDSVNCGADFDFGIADLDDLVNPNCEGVELSSFPPFGDEGFLGEDFPGECLPGDMPAQEPTIFADDELGACLLSELGSCAALRIVRRPASLRKGAIGVRVKLPAAASGVCRAKLRLEALIDGQGRAQRRKLKIGAEPFSLRPGKAKRFEVQVSHAGRRLVHREDQISAKVAVFTRGADSSKVASAVIRIGSRHR